MGVLADFVYGHTSLAHQLFGTPMFSNGGQLDWDFPELTKAQDNAVWDAIRASDTYWKDLYPLISVGEYRQLLEFAEDNEIWYVTNRKDNAVDQTVPWLTMWEFPQADHVVFTKNKRATLEGLEVAHMVEDNPHNFEELVKWGGKTWVRDWPYNRDTYMDLPRVGSVAEFLRGVA